MAFIDQRLPTQVEINAVRRDAEDIEIVTTDGGFEVRNARRAQSLREFDIAFPTGDGASTVIAAVVALYKVARGPLNAFRFRDFLDYELTLEPIGVGDGANHDFQIKQSWTVAGDTESRAITRPVTPMSVYLDGVLQSSGYTVNYSTGVVHFTIAPAVAKVVAVTGTFDLPVRFDQPLPMTAIDGRLRHIDTITLKELREA